MASPNTVALRGTRAAQPAASSRANGTLYYVTDEATTEQAVSGVWLTYSDGGVGTGDVTASGTLTSGRVIVGGGTQVVSALGSAGTTTTLLHGGSPPTFSAVTEADQSTSDVTTRDVSSVKHGYAPKSPGDATKFLNGAAFNGYAAVKDSDLSVSDITTNNVTALQHGFAPKLPADPTKYLDGTGAYSTPAGSGSGTVTNTGALPSGRIVIGNGASDVVAMGTLGSANTLLHGNTLGAPTFGAVSELDLGLTDVATANTSSSAHGLAPKTPGDATTFLNGATTPSYAAVKDSDLSLSDITTNDVSITKHGLTPKLPNDSTKFLSGAGTYLVPAGSGTGTVTNTGTLTDHGVIVGNGGADVSAVAVGTTNTVMHGNTAADPSFSAVVEADITLADNLTNNVATTKHGLTPKLSGNVLQFLSGTGTWVIPAGSGTGTVTHTGTLDANHLVIGDSDADVQIVASLGTTTTLLHGNALGPPSFSAVVEGDLSTTDVTTANVTSTKHGFAPKSPASATTFLNGAATPAYAAVKDSDLAVTDVTTNNVSASAHGFAPKFPNDATKFLSGAGTYLVPAGSGTGTVTNTGTLTNGGVIVGNGGADVSAIGLGTATTLLHGNVAGDPSYSPVVENDISLVNVTTNNVSTVRHGFAPVLPNDPTRYLDGSGAYSVPVGSSTGTVTNGNVLTSNRLVLGNGGVSVVAMGTLGGATQVLHGNVAGAPTFSGVAEIDLAFTDVTTGNASTSQHGLAPKLSGVASKYLNGAGVFAGLSVFPQTGAITPTLKAGTGSPVNLYDEPQGSMYLRTDGTPSTTIYIKTAAGAANWTPISAAPPLASAG